MTFRERMHWAFRMALLAFILTSVAFLSAITAMRFAIQGREVTMPDVTGKKAVVAQQTLQGRGVGFKVEDRIFNPLPVDTVVRQTPPPGIQVKIGQFAHVVISLGPQKVTIPTLTEHSVRAARIELLRSEMQVGEISQAYVPTTEEDAVLQQDPAPGTSDITSPHVDLLVSLGARPAAYVMPELIGLTLPEAEAKFSGTGLKVAKLTFAAVAGGLHGTVVGQTPSRGTRVDASTAIELQLAE
ncbi:MAG: PASTA domain-containing protein [Candidatus Acidiferrales bacterium]